jgi:mannose-1-phosphate guanylyltransferase/phosphomannomutase
VRALILCGGRGTRLGALTADTPKPLLPIDGEPLLGYTLALLARSGIPEVAINLHHLGSRIESYVGSGARFGAAVTYACEESLLGTAGTVRSLSGFFGEDDGLVLYGDLLLDVDLGAMTARHRACGASGTLMLHRRARSNSRVTMDSTDRIISFLERPSDSASPTPTSDTWVNSGVAILSRGLRDRIPSTLPCDLPRDLYAPLADRERLFGFPLSGYRCAIDSPARYEEACQAVREGRVRRPW